jgi:hypothetical protein
MMKNGHFEPSPFAHLAELGNAPPSADVLAFAEDLEKVRALLKTGVLDAYPPDERIRIGWNIVRHDREVIN